MAGPRGTADDGDMTQTPDEQQGRCPGANGDGLWTWLRDLGVQRRSKGRWFAGVCSGLADRLGVDPVLVRAVFILVLIFGGLGLPLYLAAWAVLPDRHGEIAAENAIRHRDGRSIVLLVVVGISVLGSLSNKWWLWLTLVPVGLFLFWVLRSARSGKSSDEIGREASSFATKLGDTVSGWVSSPGSSSGSTQVSQPRETPEQARTPESGPTGAHAAAAAPGAPVTLDQGNPPPPMWHGAAPHGMGPGRTGSVAAPPTRVDRDRRQRAGCLGLLLVIGLAVASYAGGSQVQSRFAWSTSTPETFALACALGGVGLALFIVGLTGRRAGFLTVLATVLAITAVTGTMGQAPGFVKGGLGDRIWKVSDGIPAGGYHLGAGRATLDLAGATADQEVTLEQGLGDLTILVPPGVRVTIDGTVSVGDLITQQPDGTTTRDDNVDSVNRAFGAGTTTIHVTARLGAGNLTIKEQ